MSTLEIEQIPTRTDKYVYLLKDSGQGRSWILRMQNRCSRRWTGWDGN